MIPHNDDDDNGGYNELSIGTYMRVVLCLCTTYNEQIFFKADNIRAELCLSVSCIEDCIRAHVWVYAMDVHTSVVDIF